MDQVTVPRAVAQQALEALGKWSSGHDMDAVELNDLIATLEAALEQPEQCSCGDRPKGKCPGEWEPGCDLGNNPKYARRVPLEQREQENPTRQMPEWMDYDQATDVLTIHGRRYSAAMFGERGFLSPAGTLLQVSEGQPDCVTLMTILPTEPK